MFSQIKIYFLRKEVQRRHDIAWTRYQLAGAEENWHWMTRYNRRMYNFLQKKKAEYEN